MTKTWTLTVDRVFDASPEDLWDAWTKPERFSRWYNPSPGMDLVVHEFDLRAGGRIRFEMPMPRGRRGPVTDGIFHAIEPPRRLVFGAADRSSLNDVQIEPEGRGTRVTVTWTTDDSRMATQEMQGMARAAWEASCAKLEASLAG